MMSHVPQLDVGLGRRNNWKHLVEELLERAPVHPPVPANQRAIAAAAAKSSFVDGLNSILLMTLVETARSSDAPRLTGRRGLLAAMILPIGRPRRTQMKIAVVGKGNVGGGLADLWEKAGHEVQRIGREGGDVSDAEAVLIAIPGRQVAGAFKTVKGLDGKTVIDATNLVGALPPDGFDSNAEFIKSKTGGPTAKSFNLNFASMYGKIAGARDAPGNIWCGDEEAREVVEQLNRDAGFDPIYVGALEKAGIQETSVQLWFAIAQGGMGQFFYRMAPPEQV